MAVRFPRDVVLEFYLGRWVNVAALPEPRRLLQTDPLTVVWGLPSEQSGAKAPPSTAEGTLRNVGGHWTPGNPMSDYFDYLQGRNAPSRLALRASRDTFTGRTSAFSWLSTETGDGWNAASSGAGSQSVGGGLGSHSVNAASAYQMSYIGDRYADCQAALTSPSSSLAFVPTAGAPWEPLNLVLRYQPSGPMAGEHYLLRCEIRVGDGLYATINHETIGVSTPLTSTIGPLSDSIGGLNQNVAIRAKFQMERHTLRAKVYRAGPSNDPDQYEPLGWQLSAHHERLADGFPGVRTGVAAGNTNTKPIRVDYDDWELRLLRHTGELARLQPAWDESHRIKTASFKAADVTQRLGRPERARLSSAPRRYMAGNSEFATVDHWPLDEEVTAARQGVNTQGGADAYLVRGTFGGDVVGSVNWGASDQFLTSVDRYVTIGNGMAMRFPTRADGLAASASVTAAIRPSPDATVTLIYTLGGLDAFLYYVGRIPGSWEFWGWNAGLGVFDLMSSGELVSGGRADVWVTLGVTLFANGAGNIGFHNNIDGLTLGVGNWNLAGSYAPMNLFRALTNPPRQGGTGDVGISSVVTTSSTLQTIISGSTQSIGSRISNVIKGWVGETAGLRAYRLCAEEGLPFDYVGDLAATRAMGPQRPLPLLDLLTECAEADQGLLYAPRYTPGVALRTRLSLLAQQTALSLDYTGRQVAEPFAPAADDRPVANLVRAERINGGSAIVEQTSGPMNTGDPGVDPNAAGVVPAEARVNVATDVLLSGVAEWVLALGTVPEVRFPRVSVDLAAPAVLSGVDPGLVTRQALQVGPGDRLRVTGMTEADFYQDLDQIVRGGREVLPDSTLHRLTFNTAPYAPFRTGVYNDAGSRYGLESRLNSATVSGSPATLSVATSGPILWTTDPAQFPFDIVVGRNGVGQRMTVSGIAGAASPQTFTISAPNVNGVSRTWPANTEIRLHEEVRYG